VSPRTGEKLKQIRLRLGLTTRDVDHISRKISEAEGNEEFVVSHARLIQIENGESTPSIYKLYTLSAAYGKKMEDLLSLYLDLERIVSYHVSLELENTHLADIDPASQSRLVNFPVRFDPSFNVDNTALLSRLVEVWGDVPIGLIQHLDLRKSRYGFIGLADYTMFPLLRPGSFVQIDQEQKPATGAAYRTEYDRPLYFIELRYGYICSWCEMHRNRLVSIPHPLSPCSIREFAYPMEAEIIGRVTAIAARLTTPATRSASPKLPKQP
jgi:transcriptional regulator with XRE-family HTH domain